MTYQVLARKWRPRDFASCVGQEHVVRALSHALEQQRLHHAYLFTGTRGVGKTTLARILAKALNCVGVDGQGGITAKPCNQCEACTAIDAGRFVDYIEMDAASNRGVDEMTTLLERAVYSPSNARFKVYMIDEVHMLTTHAFNAMLKTLEEPPDYVKFILATTDPQKIPVTVLSRCLQFNLKQMTPAGIVGRFDEILAEEGIAAEPPALRLLAHAARGSMRDGLSLLDQAIAFAGGTVTLDAVGAMLGAIDTTNLERILDAVAARDAKTLLAISDEMAVRSYSFAQALRDLGSLLHRVALAQQVPDAADEALGDAAADAETVRRFAKTFAPDEVQLYYQIALHGRNDLSLAPDEYAGFTMTLLRMLAFAPADAAVSSRQSAVGSRESGAVGAVAAPSQPTPTGSRITEHGSRATAHRLPITDHQDGPSLVEQLNLTGFTRELAVRSELVSSEGNHYKLRVPVKTLAEGGTLERLKAALTQHLGQPVKLSVEVGATAGPTAKGRADEARAEQQKRAEEAIYADPFVKQLIDNFGATVDPQSIKPAT
ncbi:MAG: DNA polymerase III subunit gamma/tau [Betaproteobacteria bacterium]